MNKEDVLLTDDELQNISDNVACSYIGAKARKAKDGDIEKEISHAIAYVQSRRDYEWLHEICIEHDHIQIVGSEEDYKDAGCPQFERKDCPECMEAWKKELGL